MRKEIRTGDIEVTGVEGDGITIDPTKTKHVVMGNITMTGVGGCGIRIGVDEAPKEKSKLNSFAESVCRGIAEGTAKGFLP